MNKKIAIVGATGYTGSELVRILSLHPEVEVSLITSESKSGKPFSDIHPQYYAIAENKLEKMAALKDHDPDLVFLALPHGVSMDFIRDYGYSRWPVVDLSGDFRLSNVRLYEQWYKKSHVSPEAYADAVFGMPELFRAQIGKARLVANPGCYPTSAILPLAPLLKEGLIEPQGILVDAKSGVTGAGASASEKTHYPNVYDNFSVYGLKTHRHTPEMQDALQRYTGTGVELLFTPHLLPVSRGILATVYARPAGKVTEDSLREAMQEHYGDEPFIRLCDTPPAIQHVRGSNYANIFVTYDERTNRVIAISCIDNLVKGAAGQAVQNMNLLLGLPEDAGLRTLPLSP